MASFDRDTQALSDWIGAATGVAFTKPFADELKDGVQLCALANAVQPGCIRKVNTSSLAFKQMDNISNFLKAVKGMGLHQKDTFDTIDLYEQREMARVVSSLTAFGALVNAKADYAGPKLRTNVKFASKNVRKFTASQQAAQRYAAAGTGCTGGSAGIMERSEVKKPGITAGNNAVGAGTSDGTLSGINSGSAKIMQRSETYKGGITFGNTQSGAGTADLTAQTAGSAGVMQRSETYKGGITFGNTQSGAGTADLTAQTAGSAGVMQRSETTRQGITFGNQAAGAGSADLTAQTAGSAGVMQRSETTSEGICFGAGVDNDAGLTGGITSMSLLEAEVQRESLGAVEAC